MRRRAMMLFAACAALSLLVPITSASAERASIPEGAIPLEGGGYAVELSAPSPDWYTAELHQRVVDAGAEGVPLPPEAKAQLPASALAWTGIRPGAWMFFPSWCTMNFVFHDGAATGDTGGPGNGKGNGKKPATDTTAAGSWYIGTAGHCAEVGDEVTLIAAPGVLMTIGRTVKSYNEEIGKDFALIEIYPEMVQYINPSMAIIGGPTGVNQAAVGDPILHVGHGLGMGTGGTPRAGLVTYTGNGDHKANSAYAWDGAAINGDSGSGVRHANGLAEGNLTHLVVGADYVPAFIAGTTATYMEQLAGVPICRGSLVPSPAPSPVCEP